MFRGFLIIKMTFSYFPGIFKNHAPAVKTSCKGNKIIQNKIYYEIWTLYECIELQPTIVCCNKWMNSFQLNWIIYDLSEITPWSFSLLTQQISSDRYRIIFFYFSQTLPLTFFSCSGCKSVFFPFPSALSSYFIVIFFLSTSVIL